MTAQSQLEAYLGEFRRRLKALIVARGAAVLATAALVVTLVAVYFGIRRAFDPQIVISARDRAAGAARRHRRRASSCCRCARLRAAAASRTSNGARPISMAASKPMTASCTDRPSGRRRSSVSWPRTRWPSRAVFPSR